MKIYNNIFSFTNEKTDGQVLRKKQLSKKKFFFSILLILKFSSSVGSNITTYLRQSTPGACADWLIRKIFLPNAMAFFTQF